MQIKQLHVLHADSAEKITALVKLMLLQNRSIQTITTTNMLAKAEEIVARKKTDVVILDLQFHEGNGLAFLKWVKKTYPRVCVIILSMHSDDCHREAAKQAGADYFLDKSFEFEKLHNILAEINKQEVS